MIHIWYFYLCVCIMVLNVVVVRLLADDPYNNLCLPLNIAVLVELKKINGMHWHVLLTIIYIRDTHYATYREVELSVFLSTTMKTQNFH